MVTVADLFLFSWTTSVAFQTLSIFCKCLKDCFNNWSVDRQTNSRLLVFHKVLFFPDSRLFCEKYFSSEGCHFRKCRNAHYRTSLGELLDVLKNTQASLDICVFTISCEELANAVLKLHNAGIAVRIVTNEEQEALCGSHVERFQRHGVPVRHDQTSFYMHHKFVIIDDVILITGSFNWTKQAVIGNRENVLVTNNPEIVTPYCQEFEKLWQLYRPEKGQ